MNTPLPMSVKNKTRECLLVGLFVSKEHVCLKGTLMSIAFLSLVLCTAPNTSVLCIGDSITHGWAREGNLDCPHENCGSSRKFLERLEDWQEGKHWGTIVFNC